LTLKKQAHLLDEFKEEEDQDLPEQESEFENRSELQELKITAQVMGYHALRFILPAVAVIFTLACGITLSVWALNQLNKLPIQAFPASTAAVDKNDQDQKNKADKLKGRAPSVVHAPVQKKAPKVKVQKAQVKKYPQRRSAYQDPWADYYYYEPSHPRGGEITHSDGMVTEYRWNKKH